MIKLIVTDIDGTIVKHDNTLNDSMRDYLKYMQDKGIKICLASGRMYEGACPVAQMIGLNSPVVCYQGAMVREYQNSDKILWHRSIKPEVVKKVVTFLRKYNVHINLYSDDVLYVENEEHMEEYCSGRFTHYTKVNFDEMEIGLVSKLLVIEYDREKILKVKKALEENFGEYLQLVFSMDFYLEITDIEASKGNAVKFLADYYNVGLDEVLCSGNQDNDLSMLEVAGVKIAMGDSTQSLKNIATYICPPVHEDGLIDACKRFVLCE